MSHGCCGSMRIISVGGKVSDCFGASIGDKKHDGYVPRDLGIGGGDYLEFEYCLNCGRIVGEWPLPETELERGTSEEEEEEPTFKLAEDEDAQ